MIRKAGIDDVEQIHAIVTDYAAQGIMLPKTVHQVYENLRDFTVFVDAAGKIGGAAALHLFWKDIAEVRSVAVRPDLKGQKIGSRLIDAICDEARGLHLPRVFLLTYSPTYFSKQGFHKVDRGLLPHKIWADCSVCPFFDDCKEVAMVRDLVDNPPPLIANLAIEGLPRLHTQNRLAQFYP
ncbi:MAG: N-acetyltransferase [Planctomycetota bacterium]